MKLRIRSTSTLVVAMLSLLAWASAQAPMQLTPFSADMQFSSTHNSNAHEMNGKMYLTQGHMRMDMQAGPRGQSVMITDFATKTTDMLMPAQHMYMEFKADSAQGHRPGMMPSIKPFRDPSNPCAAEEGMTCKNLGVEQVNGRTCDHWQITNKDGKVSNVWIDQRIHFPIKTVSEDATWQLTNIQEGQQDASLFQIPAGYQKMDMSGMMQGAHPPQQ